jgi:hypothetical protein
MSFLNTLRRLFGRRQTPAPQPHPDPPAALYVRVSVWQDGTSIRPTAGSLTLDDGRQIPATVDGGFRLKVQLPPEVPYGWHAELWVRWGLAVRYQDWALFHVTLAADLDVDLPATRTPAPELGVVGTFFRRDGGAPHTVIGCSDLQLFDGWLAGGRDAVRPMVEQRKALGFNLLRVWSICAFLFRLDPDDPVLDHFYPNLLDFLTYVCVEVGLNVELTAFVDVNRPELLGLDVARHWQNLRAVLQQPEFRHRVLLERVNEQDIGVNTIALAEFPPPAEVRLAGAGSGGADARPPVDVPGWTYAGFHPDRSADWPRKVGHNAMEDLADKFGVPGTSNETCRPDQGRGPVAADFFDAAANAALLSAGATFHSQAGKDSVLLGGDELVCAMAWVAGARAVPLEFQQGTYIAGHLQGFPINWSDGDSARAHGRRLGFRACLSLPQLRRDYVPLGVDGWRIVSQTGSVVLVTR